MIKLYFSYLSFVLLFFSHVDAQEVLLSEKFDNGIPEGWQVESSNNKRSWIHKTYRDQNYMQMSAFGGKGNPGYSVKTKLHSPLIEPSERICKLRFVFADAFQNGQPLEVMLSDKKKKPIRSLPKTAWKDLVNNPNSYDNNYEPTEWINLPQVNEPYHISFVYNSEQGSEIVTTLIQLDEVDVWCE